MKGADFMQTVKDMREMDNAQSSRFCKRIGSTVFTVNIYFKEGSKEPLKEKMFRMMKSDLTNDGLCSKLTLPQADAPPERGSA
jgi:hypothetical protein